MYSFFDIIADYERLEYLPENQIGSNMRMAGRNGRIASPAISLLGGRLDMMMGALSLRIIRLMFLRIAEANFPLFTPCGYCRENKDSLISAISLQAGSCDRKIA